VAVNNDILGKVGDLQQQGSSKPQIYDSLRREGYTNVQIDDAINQKELTMQDLDEGLDDAPEPGLKPSMLNEPSKSEPSMIENYGGFSGTNFQGEISSSRNLDDVEALIESIIEEKWRTTIERFGNLDVWREKVRTDVGTIKKELIRLEHMFENIEKAILGKITQYDRNIVNIGNEIKVLEQVFQKIINPLTTNIKELGRITKELKEK
jgi:hypothetical protein